MRKEYLFSPDTANKKNVFFLKEINLVILKILTNDIILDV